MRYKIGERVKWVSQSGGFIKKKEGVIVEIVSPDKLPEDRISATHFPGGTRNHTSFVVKVGSKTYWPRVNGLIKVL